MFISIVLIFAGLALMAAFFAVATRHASKTTVNAATGLRHGGALIGLVYLIGFGLPVFGMTAALQPIV